LGVDAQVQGVDDTHAIALYSSIADIFIPEVVVSENDVIVANVEDDR